MPAGELALTSGGDRIFPKGLPIGRVSKVSPGSDFFLNIRVKPTANLSKLEEVLIVTRVDERQATPTQAGRVRAADVLAERLPAVPPKTEATGAAPTGTPPQSGTALESKPTQAKPKAPAPTGDDSVDAPVARKAAKPAPSAGTPAEPATPGASEKTSEKSVKPPVEPRPQPPAQDNPQ